MSLVISQTLPYSSTDLRLEDTKRWSRLFPLMRPSVKVVETPSGQAVVVDTVLANSKNTLVAAIGAVGNFSAKILSESHLAAFSTEPISSEDILKTLKKSGLPVENRVVVIRAASEQNLRIFPGGIEVAVVGALTLDHVLSLLSASNTQTK
jgi:hypothetical protein